MGFLSRLFGTREKEEERREKEPEEEVTCPHTALTQHWDLPEQIGKAEIAHYVCDSCAETFTYQQAQMFMEKAPKLFPTEEEKRPEV